MFMKRLLKGDRKELTKATTGLNFDAMLITSLIPLRGGRINVRSQKRTIIPSFGPYIAATGVKPC